MEEAQHAQIDTLMVEEMIASLPLAERERALEGYLEIGTFLDAGLKQQAELDLASLELAARRSFTAAERERFVSQQHQAMRWTFLGSGISHPHFLRSVQALSPAQAARLAEVAKVFY